MYASLLILDKTQLNKAFKRDAYAVHKIVYDLFPGNRRNFLYLDKGMKGQTRQILILSEQRPERPSIGTLHTKEIPSYFLSKEVYAFEIKLNPVVRHGLEERPIKNKNEIMEWFFKRQSSWGFVADSEKLEIVDQGLQTFERKGMRISHNQATCRGVLRVVDREKFIHSFQHGIGRGKAFGFGLLQIVPIN